LPRGGEQDLSDSKIICRLKKIQNDLRMALQNFVFLKFLARNEKGRCLVKDSSIVRSVFYILKRLR
jgi:hypothetical protein